MKPNLPFPILPVVVASALALSACASVRDFFDSPTSLSDQWSKQMVQFRIAPVFPPGQDVQIGDVFIACTGTVDGKDLGFVPGLSAFPIKLTRVAGVNDFLDAHYKASVQLLPDETKPSLASKTGFLKLRNLSLPEFFQVRAKGSQLSALLPVGTTLAGFGLSSEDVDSVDVSVTSAGSAALPLISMADLVATNLSMKVSDIRGVKASYHDTVCAPAKLKAQTLIVSEVYAAYSMALSVNVKKSSAFGASAALTLPSDSTRKAAFEALSQYFKSSPAASAPAQPAAPASANGMGEAQAARDQRFVTALQAMLNGANESYRMDHPGVKVGIYRGSQAGIRMDRTFAEPVVIGFRFLQLLEGKDEGWTVASMPGNVTVPVIHPAPQ